LGIPDLDARAADRKPQPLVARRSRGEPIANSLVRPSWIWPHRAVSLVGRMKNADSGKKGVCASACSRKLCVLHLGPVRLLRISDSWWFGEGVTGREKTTRNRLQGDTRLDQRSK